jgi:choline dehydrogenase
MAPTIEPRYLDDPLDRRVIVAGIRMLRDIYAQPAFRDLFDVEMLPGPDAKSTADLLAFARKGGGTVFHCVGTCRMGAADDRMAVVDEKLRVRGVEALRVVDASVMPHVTSANTNAASLMIGEHGARLILGS